MQYRHLRNLPLHSPPHWAMGFSGQYLITAACFEHVPIIGQSANRLTECEETLLAVCQKYASKVYSWCVLPNHYPLLVGSRRIKSLCRDLGNFHGRSSFAWNGEDGQRGRKVWFRCFDREIRSERHFWATLNYIHHNPIHHGYVSNGKTGFGPAQQSSWIVWAATALLRFGKIIRFWITAKAGTYS